MRAEEKLSFGPFQLDLRSWELRRRGVRIRVQKQPLQLLALLLKRPGELITREEMRQHLWPDGTYLDYDHGLNRSMNKLRQALIDSSAKPRYIETLPALGYRFVGEVEGPKATSEQDLRTGPTQSTGNPPNQRNLGIANGHGRSSTCIYLEPATEHVAAGPFSSCSGPLPVGSPFYLERDVDSSAQRAVDSRESVILIKGARQTGKTSLLARVLARSRHLGQHTVATDLQKLGRNALADLDSFLFALSSMLGDSLGACFSRTLNGDPRRSAISSFERLLGQAVSSLSGHLVWVIDEADRIFPRPYAGEFFGLLRAWHNERCLDPGSHWKSLSIVIAYATEAHLFITDPNQSPFNVGSKFELPDFTLQQIAELNTRYGSPLNEDGISHLHLLLGGHPFLIQRALCEVASRRHSIDTLLISATDEDGPFSEHLRHMLLTAERSTDLLPSIRGILAGTGAISADHFYRLRAFGIASGDRARNAHPRCRVYRDFLSRHLL